MKITLKRISSKSVIIIFLVGLLLLSVFNTYLIFEGNQSILRTGIVKYDFVVSQDGNNYQIKNMLTGYVTRGFQSTSAAINAALLEGKSIYINPGSYELTENIAIINKVNAEISGNGNAVINGNGHTILIYGDNHTAQQSPLISGLTLTNTTIRVENALGTTIQDILFANTTTAIEFANTKTWSEYNKIENCQFINATEGIVFRTPIGNATGSYASSIIERCSFNIRDFSIGIKVEKLAEFSDSQIQNVRFWMGEYDRANQTGLFVDGSMFQTSLSAVVFESFTSDPVYIFGIEIGDNCNPAPTIGTSVSFLGNWTAKVHDTQGIWVNGEETVFKRENLPVPVGTNNQYAGTQSFHLRPLTVSSFKPKIIVDGSFSRNETVTVRIRIEYVDNVVSDPVVRVFSNSGSVWLTDDEMMRLFPSQSIIWIIIVDAKTDAASTDALVKVSGYGIAG